MSLVANWPTSGMVLQVARMLWWYQLFIDIVNPQWTAGTTDVREPSSFAKTDVVCFHADPYHVWNRTLLLQRTGTPLDRHKKCKLVITSHLAYVMPLVMCVLDDDLRISAAWNLYLLFLMLENHGPNRTLRRHLINHVISPSDSKSEHISSKCAPSSVWSWN